jgi:hypothetical protein
VISGPSESPLEKAELIRHVDRRDTRFEWTGIIKVTLVPVAAPGYLAFPVTHGLIPGHMVLGALVFEHLTQRVLPHIQMGIVLQAARLALLVRIALHAAAS